MNKIIAISTVLFLGLLMAALPSFAAQNPGTQVAKILEYRVTLNLTDSQVKKLEIVERTAQQKMQDAKFQADIRMGEIEKFTSNWTDMNSVAVLALIKEYFQFQSDYRTAEMQAIIQARAILDLNQLNRFQQVVSIESLMLNMQEMAER